MPSHHPHPPRRRPLSALLKLNLRSARSLAVVGIGSDLRGDDIAGILALRELRAALAGAKAQNIADRIRLFDGGTAPENLTGEIARFRPSHILLVDAADLGLKPGAATLIEPEAAAGMSFSTHVLPLSILADYLKNALPCRIMILGIQPGPTAFSAKHSPAIDQAARRLARLILNAVPLCKVKKPA
ncbi:MAG: hydrogenase 3 maturation endopeptidase HyCI [Kiritimatiellia bacterium]|jgi:hydrogenase 3 maturation protease